jgi:hypothetical protein
MQPESSAEFLSCGLLELMIFQNRRTANLSLSIHEAPGFTLGCCRNASPTFADLAMTEFS